jgi:hypothetical protein
MVSTRDPRAAELRVGPGRPGRLVRGIPCAWKKPPERGNSDGPAESLGEGGLAAGADLDLNSRDPSISLPVIMVSIVQPMKTRFVFEQTGNLSHGRAFR